MTAKVKVGIVLFVLTAVAAGASAHTEEEFVAKGREMIGTSMSTYFDNEDDLLAAAESDDPLYHWDNKTQDGFFNFFVTNDWPRADCEMAFDKYLVWVSTNDMSAFSSDERAHARGAISQCLCMNYTNALVTLRWYALNPTAIDRFRVMDLSVRMGDVDEPSAVFTEAIVTNTALFSPEDLRSVISTYCRKLLAVDTNDVAKVAIRDRGVRLFYTNRHNLFNGVSLDNLFVAAIPGYVYSSNRLEYADYVLSWATNNDWRAMRDHFVAITNHLLSAGRPLVELKLDESTSP
jgi:hypothetical protein